MMGCCSQMPSSREAPCGRAAWLLRLFTSGYTVRLPVRIERRRVRFLIISDIHSNLEAFEKCMQVAKDRYDDVVCLGDLVGYGPDPNAIVDALKELASVTIRGNHDKACCGITDASDFNPLARASAVWTRE